MRPTGCTFRSVPKTSHGGFTRVHKSDDQAGDDADVLPASGHGDGLDTVEFVTLGLRAFPGEELFHIQRFQRCAHASVRLRPGMAVAGFHHQRHVEMDGTFHHLAGDRGELVGFILRRFKQKFVVHLKEQA